MYVCMRICMHIVVQLNARCCLMLRCVACSIFFTWVILLFDDVMYYASIVIMM